MTLEQLSILLELSHTHSMSLCAENLNMTKANISRAINQLESELSAKLFMKSHQGSFLTPLGEQVCDYAASILKDKKRIETLCQSITPSIKTLNIMFTEAYAFIIPDITDQFRQKMTDAKTLHLTSLPAAHLNHIIHYANPDVAFSTLLTSELASLARYEEEYYIYKVYDEQLTLMVNKNNLPTDVTNGQISARQLKNYSLLVISNELILQDNIMKQSSLIGSFLEEYDLYKEALIIQSNSLPLFKYYLEKPNHGLLCDVFSMKHSSLFDLKNFAFLTIKPICSESRVILLNKNSPYFNLINEALYVIQNKYGDDFPYLNKLNGTFTTLSDS